METKDTNGNILNDGDSVTLTKDLKVKGSSLNLKRGKLIKKIRLTHSPEEIECREGKSTIVLKTCFLKKV
jgi:protein PhnA